MSMRLLTIWRTQGAGKSRDSRRKETETSPCLTCLENILQVETPEVAPLISCGMMSVNRREVTQWVCAAESVKVARVKTLTQGDGGKKARVQ